MRNIPCMYRERERELQCIGIDQVPWRSYRWSRKFLVRHDNPTKLENGFVLTSRGVQAQTSLRVRHETLATLGYLGREFIPWRWGADTMPVKRSHTREGPRERVHPQLGPVNSLKVSRKATFARRSSMVLAEIFDQSSAAPWRKYATEKLLPECLNV